MGNRTTGMKRNRGLRFLPSIDLLLASFAWPGPSECSRSIPNSAIGFAPNVDTTCLGRRYRQVSAPGQVAYPAANCGFPNSWRSLPGHSPGPVFRLVGRQGHRAARRYQLPYRRARQLCRWMVAKSREDGKVFSEPGKGAPGFSLERIKPASSGAASSLRWCRTNVQAFFKGFVGAAAAEGRALPRSDTKEQHS